MKKSIIALAASIAAVSFAPVATAADKLLLKTPIAFKSTLPGLGSPIPRVAKELDRMSGGSLKMKVYEPGKLVKAFEILDTVSSGKINSGYATAGYWSGKMPAASLFSAVPFGPETGEYMAWMYYGNGLKLYQEMYDKNGYNVKVLPCAIIAPETSGWFAKEINKPEDLKGLKMRFFGLGALVMQKLGVSTQLLAGADIYPALEKGVIDATEFSMPITDIKYGFHQIAKYNYFPGWHQQTSCSEILMNRKAYQALPKGYQKLIEVAAGDQVMRTFAETEATNPPALLKMQKENGVIVKRWPDSELAKFEKAWLDVVKEESAADPNFKKIADDYLAFRKLYKIWGDAQSMQGSYLK